MSCKQESEFGKFGNKEVASVAKLYIRSEPVLLDRFIEELQAMCAGAGEHAYLEAV